MTGRRPVVLLLLVMAFSLHAQYTYYYTDSLTSISGKWNQNGSVTASSSGLTATSTSGGSLIYSGTMPGPAGEYEVAMTLTLTASGGTYVSYLNASSNALSGPSNAGTYYDVELQNPTFSGGTCSATLALNKNGSGGVSTLTSTTVSCHSGMVIRAVHTISSQLIVYVDNVTFLYAGDSELTSGQPGVGARGTTSGNSIALARLGQLDTVAPNSFDSSLIGTSSFSNRVDLQSPGVSDNAGGTGIMSYQITKNGVLLNAGVTPEWSDTAVSPSTTYTYYIAALDYHLNYSVTRRAALWYGQPPRQRTTWAPTCANGGATANFE
jgi:hypothetical protein